MKPGHRFVITRNAMPVTTISMAHNMICCGLNNNFNYIYLRSKEKHATQKEEQNQQIPSEEMRYDLTVDSMFECFFHAPILIPFLVFIPMTLLSIFSSSSISLWHTPLLSSDGFPSAKKMNIHFSRSNTNLIRQSYCLKIEIREKCIV